MKLFLDENLSPQHASELRAEGHDAVAVLEAGLSGASDEQVLSFAVEHGRVLVTLDADFANVISMDTSLSSTTRRFESEADQQSGIPPLDSRLTATYISG